MDSVDTVNNVLFGTKFSHCLFFTAGLGQLPSIIAFNKSLYLHCYFAFAAAALLTLPWPAGWGFGQQGDALTGSQCTVPATEK